MTQKPTQKNILIIHGPNMNLLGHRKIEASPNITLDKLNKNLRKVASRLALKLKIVQTNDEARAVTIVQRQRNKFCGLLLFPGPWQKSADTVQDVSIASAIVSSCSPELNLERDNGSILFATPPSSLLKF